VDGLFTYIHVLTRPALLLAATVDLPAPAPRPPGQPLTPAGYASPSMPGILPGSDYPPGLAKYGSLVSRQAEKLLGFVPDFRLVR
jgi:hypothetical protein